jgi:hypothetical protein
MFRAFKFRFDVDILDFLGHFSNKVGKIVFNFLVTVFVDVPNRLVFVPCKPLQLSLMIAS